MSVDRVTFNLPEAREWLQSALEAHGLELTPCAREVLEAVKHIDNARKMLREEKTP